MRIDPRLVALCGSERRIRVLAVLANAHRPLTGYRVAQTGGVPNSKIYQELHRLEAARLVKERLAGWVLIDPDLRRLLRKRIRLLWWEDWFSHCAAICRASRDLPAVVRPTRFSASAGWKPRKPARFRRDRRKDLILSEMGLRPSIHGEPRRV